MLFAVTSIGGQYEVNIRRRAHSERLVSGSVARGWHQYQGAVGEYVVFAVAADGQAPKHAVRSSRSHGRYPRPDGLLALPDYRATGHAYAKGGPDTALVPGKSVGRVLRLTEQYLVRRYR